MQINNSDLDILLEKLKSSNLEEIEYQEADFRIKLVGKKEMRPSDLNSFFNEGKNFEVQSNDKKQNNQTQTDSQKNDNVVEMKSNLIGSFYSTKTPDSPALVKVGDKIKVGQVIAVIEAMKIIHEVKSEMDGVIVKICPTEGQFVDLDTVLFEIKK